MTGKKTRGKPKIIAVVGPTSSGKSDLAVRIALLLGSRTARKKYGINGAEIVSADSRQVYRGMDLGAGKITAREMRGIPHHLLGVASPKRAFTAIQYQKLGRRAIAKILSKDKVPIVAGGTGFYVDALLHDYSLPKVKASAKLRKELEKKSIEELFARLRQLDPRRAKDIDRKNKRRLVRALEIVVLSKKPVPAAAVSLPQTSRYDILKIGLNPPARQLRERIGRRLRKRLRQGMLREVKNLRAKTGISWRRLDNFGLDYRFASRYLRNLISREEMIARLETASRRYARRQMTWFKRDKNTHWIETCAAAAKLVRSFLQKKVPLRDKRAGH